MQTHDVIEMGGGPGGSSSARRLVQGGADMLVLDYEAFPRLKLCGGDFSIAERFRFRYPSLVRLNTRASSADMPCSNVRNRRPSAPSTGG